MKEFIMDPAVWGPLLAFAGLVIVHFTAGWGRKKEYDLSALQASVAVLQAEYERLTKEVEKLRATLVEERAAGFVVMLVVPIALLWIPDHAVQVVATATAVSSAFGWLSSALGVVYRPTGHEN